MRRFYVCVLLVVGTTVSTGRGELGSTSTLEKGEIVTFTSSTVKREGLLNTHYWTEKNERSTSKTYTLWEEADVHLVEWPGNVTVRDPDWPLLKWGKIRAKFVVNRCCESFVGIQMRAYAYRYLFLTWGYHRFLKTVTPPLTFPAKFIWSERRRRQHVATEVTVSDFVFVHDALIVVLGEDGGGVVVRVGGLELAWAMYEREKGEELVYSVAKGISSPVNKLVGQYCCEKTDKGDFCPWGETVVAYREGAWEEKIGIFVSVDGAVTFRLLLPSIPTSSSSTRLHAVLAYPDVGKVFLLHGTRNIGRLDAYSISSGVFLGGKSVTELSRFSESLHASRIGEDMSLIVWDKCNVWYSPSEGRNLTKATHYVHGFIRDGRSWINKTKKDKKGTHYIMEKYCRFGRRASLAISKWGKIALLDEDNHFHFGVDTKEGGDHGVVFPLVAMAVDMSLVAEEERFSIIPHFDRSNHPKLIYPPRYLTLPSHINFGPSYATRLAIRLLPKTVFPSEFMMPFFTNNADLPLKFANYALPPCQTSSLSINGSITQKAKYYMLPAWGHVNFTVRFKSYGERGEDLLQWEGAGENVKKFLRVRMKKRHEVEMHVDGDAWVNYEVVIWPRSVSGSRRIFMLNFYTERMLRCNIQPSVPIHLRVLDAFPPSGDGKYTPQNDDDDQRSFLRTDATHIQYGKRLEKTEDTPRTCSSSSSKKGGESCGASKGATSGMKEMDMKMAQNMDYLLNLDLHKNGDGIINHHHYRGEL